MQRTLTRPFALARCIFAMTLCLGLLGCGGSEQTGTAETDGETSTPTEDKSLQFVYVNWADGVAIHNLAKVVLEDELGYEVKLIQADVGPVYSTVADGSSDAFLDAWLPSTHEDYMERFGDDLVDLGPIYTGCRLGIVVPADAPGASITDLNENADAYDNQIVGIDAGAGIMRLTNNAIEAYDLELTLTASSGPAMTAALKSAVDDGEPIAITGWKPHWKFARWNLRFLDDPQGVYGEAEEIRAIVRTGFEKDHPEAAAFIRALSLDDQQLGSLMGAIADSDEDAEDIARAWAAEHPDLIASWLGGEEANVEGDASAEPPAAEADGATGY